MAASREQARELVGTGQVLVAGAPAAKPDRLVDPAEPLRVTAPPARFVSRGGEKLDAALEQLPVLVAGRRCLDAGASTGGFTDCLLQRGAAQIWAVDVGHGQLHPRIRADERVVVRERCNIRGLTPEQTEGTFDLVVADLSFISLAKVAPVLSRLTSCGGDLVVLVKPQFEAGRVEASRGRGIIRDPAVWQRVLTEVAQAFALADAPAQSVLRSPLKGGDGNVEFLLHAKRGVEAAVGGLDVDAVVSA